MRESIKYSVNERPNPMNAEEEKKAYANIQHQKTITLPELADHIVDHGSPFSSGSIQGILVDMTKCVSEALMEGNNVHLGDLGVLKTTITSEGASAGKDKDGNPKTASEMFTASNIKGLNVNFTQSKKLMDKLAEATFEVTITREAQQAALRAQKRGETQADWTKTSEGSEGGEGSGSGEGGEGGNG